MSEDQPDSAHRETAGGPVEQHGESYGTDRLDKTYAVTNKRSYSTLPAASEEQPPLPREVGLFAEIPPWDSPTVSEPVAEE